MKKIYLLVLIPVLLFLGYQYLPKKNIVVPSTTFSVEETINFNSDQKSEIYSETVNQGQTVFDILTKTKPTVESKSYEIGVMVNSIDGVKAGVDQKYWVYTVNGISANVAADKYILSPNDKIVWSYEGLK